MTCRNSTRGSMEKNVPIKVGVRYPVQMLEDIEGVLDASTQMSNNLKRVCKNYEFFKNCIEWEIEDLCGLRYNCQKCFTEHPSPEKHMSHRGV